MGNEYIQVLSKIRDTPWLIMPESLQTILSIVNRRMSGERLSDDQIKTLLSSGDYDHPPRGRSQGGVGVLNLQGPIFPKANLMTEYSGATSLEEFRQEFRMLMQDDRVDTIVMNIDSPGGMSDLVRETGDEIRSARSTKSIVSVGNTTVGSAALWLATQASRVYVTPSGQIGSLGAYTVHEDHSRELDNDGIKLTIISAGKYKTEGNPTEPLSDEAKAFYQERINKLYDQFVFAVAKGREVDTELVKSTYGEGRMLLPEDALEVGMIDGVMEFDAVLSTLLIGGELPAHTRSPRGTAPVGVRSQGTRFMLPDMRGRTEHVPEEHSEPGQGEMVPRPVPIERDAATGSRRDSPPAAFDPQEPIVPDELNGGNMNPLLRSYAEALGISVSDEMDDNDLRTKIGAKFGVTSSDVPTEDADFMAFVATQTNSLIDEVGPLREAHSEVIQREAFATQFPDEAARMARLEARDKETRKNEFINRVAVIKNEKGENTKFVLSTVAKDLATEAYTKLTASNLTVDDLATLINTVGSERGVVETGERGSSRSTEVPLSDGTSVLDQRQAFANVVESIMQDDKLEYRAAVKEAARREPELFAAYQGAHTRK